MTTRTQSRQIEQQEALFMRWDWEDDFFVWWDWADDKVLVSLDNSTTRTARPVI